jgi:hypothetical protein
LLVTVFGVSAQWATLEKREIVHHFTLGADVVLFTGIIWYVFASTKTQDPRAPPLWPPAPSKWAPVYLVTIGAMLVTWDPLRHVLLDHGGVFFEERTLAMYQDSKGTLSPMGRFSQISSILGMVLVMWGVLWFLRVPEGLRKWWNTGGQEVCTASA